MTDKETPIELTEEQIALGELFNAMAKRYRELLTERVELSVREETLSVSQINSNIAEKVMFEIFGHEGGPSDYMQAIKNGGLSVIKEVYNPDKENIRQALLDKCEDAVLRSLFISAAQRREIPIEVFNHRDHGTFRVPSF